MIHNKRPLSRVEMFLNTVKSTLFDSGFHDTYPTDSTTFNVEREPLSALYAYMGDYRWSEPHPSRPTVSNPEVKTIEYVENQGGDIIMIESFDGDSTAGAGRRPEILNQDVSIVFSITQKNGHTWFFCATGDCHTGVGKDGVVDSTVVLSHVVEVTPQRRHVTAVSWDDHNQLPDNVCWYECCDESNFTRDIIRSSRNNHGTKTCADWEWSDYVDDFLYTVSSQVDGGAIALRHNPKRVSKAHMELDNGMTVMVENKTTDDYTIAVVISYFPTEETYNPTKENIHYFRLEGDLPARGRGCLARNRDGIGPIYWRDTITAVTPYKKQPEK